MGWLVLSFMVCITSKTVTGPAELQCALPPSSNGSSYTIRDCEKCPRKTYVPEMTVLVNKCETGFQLPEGHDLSFCLEGSWRPGPPSCVKLCPPLVNPTRNIECRLGDDPVPCTQMMLPKTKASVRCADNYSPYFSSISFLKLECQDNGQWNSEMYGCRPECGYHTGYKQTKSKTSVFENAPWHGIIYIWKEGNLTELCAGTMISQYVMLTAAHCIYDEDSKVVQDKNILRVIIGQRVNDSNVSDNFQVEAVVRRIVVNDNYEGKSHNYANDLALLDLKYLDRFKRGPVIPACVDWSDQEDDFSLGQPGTVSGWTLSRIGKFNISHLSTMSDNDCLTDIPKSMAKYFTQDKFCAKDDGEWKKLTRKSQYWDQLVRYNQYVNANVHSATILKNMTAKVWVLPGTGITFVKNKLHFVRGVRSIIEPTNGTVVFTSVTRNLDWNYLTRSSVQQFHEEKTYNINFKDCGLMGSRYSRTEEEQNETPWLAMLYVNGWYICGGTIISPHIVVTESDCVRDPATYVITDVKTLKIGVGRRFLRQRRFEPTEQILNVQQIIIRRRLVELNLFYEEDLAIVELETNIKFTEDVRPVCVDWRNNKIVHNFNNQKLHTPEVRQIPDSIDTEYTAVDMIWLSDAVCLPSISDYERIKYTENVFCTLMNPEQLNRTDNRRWLSRGEGATVVVDGRHYLYGLRHHQNPLFHVKWHTLYTNITPHVPWLETHRLPLEYNRNFQNCGTANPKVALISNGKNATQIEHPWHVGLFYFKKPGLYEQQCGGTLVHPKIVLTAAHCVYFNFKLLDPSELRVAVGKVIKDWRVIDREEKRYEVASIIIPSSYYGSKGTFRDDIALLNLTQPVTVTDHVLPACIPKNKDSIPVGSNGSVVGWGITEHFAPSQVLQVAVLPTISLESCIALSPESFKKFISRDKLCTLYLNGTGPQEGDSGGGLTFEVNGRHYVHGVVSVKPPKENKFGAFTDVIAHFEWIREKTSEIVASL